MTVKKQNCNVSAKLRVRAFKKRCRQHSCLSCVPGSMVTKNGKEPGRGEEGLEGITEGQKSEEGSCGLQEGWR